MSALPPVGPVTRQDVSLAVNAAAVFASAYEGLLRHFDPPLTLTQMSALDLIAHADAMRPYRLGRQLMISRQLAWQTCKRLETLGLALTREQEGRSGVTVAATPAGVDHLARVAAMHDRIAASLNGGGRPLPVTPAKAAIAALVSAIEALTDEESGKPDGEDGSPAEVGAGPRPAGRGRGRRTRPSDPVGGDPASDDPAGGDPAGDDPAGVAGDEAVQ